MDLIGADNRIITARLGAALDKSNRDNTAVSPVAGISLQTTTAGGINYLDLEYASTSQLPGYTVLNSRPNGLFGGNADLGREKTRQLSLSARRENINWSASATLFYRKDDDLVDWTYFTGAPFARQANAVDIDVWGLELIVTRQWDAVQIVAAYTYLDKDADYGSATVDASFYALNHARHRATLAISYQLSAQLELRLDNEYRVQRDNPLRSSKDTAYLVSVALAWDAAAVDGLGITLTVDNLTDSNYQFFPGTPAVGRQLSVSAGYRW
jgi:outer membrane cobalamin receptor